MSVQRTAYHVHEAKRFAELSPVVGQKHHVILVRHEQPMKNIGIDKPLLGKWFGDFAPRPTEALDKESAWREFAAEYELETRMIITLTHKSNSNKLSVFR